MWSKGLKGIYVPLQGIADYVNKGWGNKVHVISGKTYQVDGTLWMDDDYEPLLWYAVVPKDVVGLQVHYVLDIAEDTEGFKERLESNNFDRVEFVWCYADGSVVTVAECEDKVALYVVPDMFTYREGGVETAQPSIKVGECRLISYIVDKAKAEYGDAMSNEQFEMFVKANISGYTVE